jgi:TonB family protein
MLEHLIVSSGHGKESRKLRLVFLGTAALVLIGCFSVFVWSIMAMELNLTEDGLELSTMIAPVPIPAVQPPKPEPQRAQPKQQAAQNNVPVRQTSMLRVDELRDIPDKISTTANTQKARTAAPYRVGKIDSDGIPAGSDPVRSGTQGGGDGDKDPIDPGKNLAQKIEKDDLPPLIEKKQPEEKKQPAIVHSNVINGKATSLPKPIYPAPAVAANAHGEVSVRVLLDEDGNVISAQVISGHPMLRQSALQAARNAKFSPTVLNGQKVKVDGTIVYRFSQV